MSRWARLRTLSSSARARRYCSRWLLARSSDSVSACCSRSSSTSSAAVSGGTAGGSLAALCRSRPDSLAVISLKPPANPDAARPPRSAQLTGGWGSASRIQGRAEQFSGHLDDGDDPLVGHACRPDDPEHAEHRLAVGVGRRDDAAIVEDLIAGLVADEYLHAFRLQALVEQVQEVAFLVERLEQPPQLLDARELGRAHEVGLALDDVLEPALTGAALEHLLRDRDRLQHDLVHVGVRLGELAQDLLARLGERAPAELLVEIVRGAFELVGREVTLELDDAVLNLAVVEHQHHQHPVLRAPRSEEHTSELHSHRHLGCRLLLEKKQAQP